MTVNESSSSEEQSVEQVDREIDPWLRKRLEYRAHPINSGGLSIGNSSRFLSANQRLVQLVQNGSHLARWVMSHTGLSSMISRVGSLGFLSGAVRSILRKASASEPTNTYRMLDLPWFRPGRNLSQDEIVDTGFSPQPESTTYASDTLKSMPEQESSKPTGTKKPVERETKPLQKISGPAETKETAGRIIVPRQKSPEPAKGKTIVKREAKPEAYFNRLISPPISRRTDADIGNKIVSTLPQNRLAVPGRQTVDIPIPGDFTRPPEIKAARSIEPRPETPISSPVTGDKSTPTISKLTSIQRPQPEKAVISSVAINKTDERQTDKVVKKTGEIDRHPPYVPAVGSSKLAEPMRSIISSEKKTEQDDIKNLSTNIIRSDSTRIIPSKTIPGETIASETIPGKKIPEKTIPGNVVSWEDIPRKTVESPAKESFTAPYTVTNTLMPDTRKTGKAESPTKESVAAPYNITHTLTPDTRKTGKVDSSATPITKETGIISPITEKSQPKKLFGVAERKSKKEASQAYPAKDLFYKKPLSIGRKIVQSLPIIRNISRKEDRTPATKASRVEKPPDVTGIHPSPVTPEITPPVPEIPRMVPEATILSSVSDTTQIQPMDLPVVPDLRETGHENLAIETLQFQVSSTTGPAVTEKGEEKAYPARDLVYNQPVSTIQQTGQQIMRTPTVIRKTSYQSSLPSESAHTAGGKRLESHDLRLLFSYPEPVQLQDVNNIEYISPSTLPETPPGVMDSSVAPDHNEIPVSNKNITDTRTVFTKPSINRGLDMVLAPVNRIALTPEREDYAQADDLTQYQQREVAILPRQPIVQTQSAQPQTSGTGQEPAIPESQNNTEVNNIQPDIKALAREIYPLIRRMIMIERERRPSR